MNFLASKENPKNEMGSKSVKKRGGVATITVFFVAAFWRERKEARVGNRAAVIF